MTAIRTLLLGAALGGALVLSAPAVAADLGGDFGGSMKDDMSITDVSMARFYIRADLTHAWMRESGMTERLFGQTWEMHDTSIHNTWGAGGGIGWYMTPNFRADVTVDYHRDAEAHGAVTLADTDVADPAHAGTWDAKFNVQSTTLLANFYYDFGARHDFNPYVGVGLGWAFNKTSGGSITDPCGCNVGIDGDEQTNFAWALMAGVTKNLGHGFNMDFGYRYLDMGGAHTGNMIDAAGLEVPDTDPVVDDITAHELRLGLRYDIY